ncbi:MAG: molybdopterin-dependent oxidoreductase, partial [Anaerolineales bacterium]|nr:molybdopterin-dependent oxidoreductase [Anaerolineales bacterium]
MSDFNYVGLPAAAIDGLDKIMGKVKYVGDMQFPGMLHVKVLRSPLPHARIKRLDIEPALKIQGVVAAITADDFVDHGAWGWPYRDQFMLAYQKVCYVGNAIAAVAAETEAAAMAGVDAIELELEALPAVFDMEKALDPDAPQIPLVPLHDEANLGERLIVRNGEPDTLLAAAPILYDETYHVSHQEHAYLETEAALAIPYPDGSITVYYNGQSPFINRDWLCAVLGLPAEKVRVIQAVVGGSFGGKDDIGYQSSAQAAVLALKTARPTRIVLMREESMIASYKREAMRVHFTLGADADGTLRAAKVDMLADSGGYTGMTTLAMLRAALHAAGAYRYQAVHVDVDTVYTNNGFCGAFRGFGNTDACAAIEQAIDDLAARLGQDPLDFRLRNCVRQGDRFMSGNIVDQPVGLADCLEWVRSRSEWDRKRQLYSGQAG